MSSSTSFVTEKYGGAVSSAYHFTRSRDLEAIAKRYGWATSVRQLEPGSLRVTGVLNATASAAVLDTAMSHRLEIRGRMQLNTAAMVLPRCATRIWLNGYELTSDKAMAVPPGGTIAAWSSGPARALVVLVRVSMLQRGQFFGPDDGRALLAGDALQAHAAQASGLQDRLRAIFCAPPEAGALTAPGEEMPAWRSTPNTARDSGTFPVISRAVEYIDANLGGTISSAELTDAAAASLSKLERAFRRELGLTPSAYICARRLHAARRELRSDCSKQVATVAFDNGFRHLGRFSGAYRRFFGELPSETLRTSA